MSELVLSIDLGSTWTKGILVDAAAGRVVARAGTPTTVEALSEGAVAVAERLAAVARSSGVRIPPRSSGDGGLLGEVPTFLSSSAKGGLAIAVVGNVPELTLRAAKTAACSAGGKVVGEYAHRLGPRDLARIEDSGADIVLLAGGTDGGDEDRILKNARILAEARLPAALLYAGNAVCRDEALGILRSRGAEASWADNILPDLDRLDYASARAAIAALFMERIVRGRGLEELSRRCAAEPRPTPAAVLDLAGLLAGGVAAGGETAAKRPGTGDGPALQGIPGAFGSSGGLLMVDMGGATTDVYSSCAPFEARAGSVYRGIPEPPLKRSVEGDLGLRISAPKVLEAVAEGGGPLAGWGRDAALGAWARSASASPAALPGCVEEEETERRLATACLAEALYRHAGTARPVWTVEGETLVQTGRDLGAVELLVASGGYLARKATGVLVAAALSGAARVAPDGSRPLLPRRLRVLRDADYIVPLAANLSVPYPDLALEIVRSSLVEAGFTMEAEKS